MSLAARCPLLFFDVDGAVLPTGGVWPPETLEDVVEVWLRGLNEGEPS